MHAAPSRLASATTRILSPASQPPSHTGIQARWRRGGAYIDGSTRVGRRARRSSPPEPAAPAAPDSECAESRGGACSKLLSRLVRRCSLEALGPPLHSSSLRETSPEPSPSFPPSSSVARSASRSCTRAHHARVSSGRAGKGACVCHAPSQSCAPTASARPSRAPCSGSARRGGASSP